MTHARFPASAQPVAPAWLPAPATFTAAAAADPVLAAIDAHAEAWAVYQVAPAGRPAEEAEDALGLALEDLLATPCLSRFGALALVRHLRWLIREEAIAAEADDVLGRMVLVREADLTRFVGSDLPPEYLPPAAPLGRLAASVVRRLPPPVPAAPGAVARAVGHVGDALAALVIVGCGGILVGLATLI